MAEPEVVYLPAGAVVRVQDSLVNPESILRQIGILILRQAAKAFSSQEFGGVPWLQRYPKQSEPFLNIAGAVTDLSTSTRVKSRRFDRRPAGIDTGDLKRSLASDSGMSVSGNSVEVGSNLPYSGRIHAGGTSSILIDRQTAANIRTVLEKAGTRYHKQRSEFIAKGYHAFEPPPGMIGKDRALFKLSFIISKKNPVFNLETETVPRPFLGVTSKTIVGIQEIIADAIRSAGRG